MAHYPCPDCCGPVECTIAADDFGDGSLAAYTQLVGTWTEAGGVVSPDTTTANQRLQWDAATLVAEYAEVVRVRMRGDAGDRLGLLLYHDANNYAVAMVTIGGGTAGRLEFEFVNDGVSNGVWTAEDECGTNQYDIPPGEWVTLTLRLQTFVTCEVIDKQLLTQATWNVMLEVDGSSETHTLGISTLDPPESALHIGLATGPAPSAAAEFDDLEIQIGSIHPPGSCELVLHCCLTQEADPLGDGDDGWTINAGSWHDETVLGHDFSWVNTVNARRTIDYQWLNDNLYLECGIGAYDLDGEAARFIFPAAETVWRMYFSIDGSDRWWIESRIFESDGDSFVFLTLEHNAIIHAWMLISGLYLELAADVNASFSPRMACEVDGCSIRFGLRRLGEFVGDDASAYIAYYSLDGGSEAESYALFDHFFFACVENRDFNRTGQVGVGSGTHVDVAGFHDFHVACGTPIDCGEHPDYDTPDPGDPGDPTGCFDGWTDMAIGDSIELTLGSWTYWFGEGCADMNCSIGSDFLTEFNATHTLVVVRKTDQYIRAEGILPDSECDECDGILISHGVDDDIHVRIPPRSVLVIERVNETTCAGKLWIRQRCADCVWYFETEFAPGVDLTSLIWALISGNSNPGGYMCCLHAGDVGIDLP